MDSLAQQEYILSLLFETVVVKKKKKIVFIYFFYLLGSRGISFEDQTKHNKPTAQLCFTIVLFVNLFQNTQFYPYYPFKFLFFCNSYYSDFFLSQKSQLE